MPPKLSRLFWYCYAPVALALGLGMLALLCLIWMPFAAILDRLLPAKAGHIVGRSVIHWGLYGYLQFLRFFCGCRFRIETDPAHRPTAASILVANHPSLLDAVLFMGLFPNVICVMKASLLDNPLLGSAARLAGFIRNSDPFDLLAQAKLAIHEQAQLLLFPEGTRTDPGSPLNVLKPSAAMISSKLGVLVQTFRIEYDQPFLAKDQALWRVPSLPMVIKLKSGAVIPAEADYVLMNERIVSSLQGQV